MSISDDTLMAYSDGELTGAELAAVERAMSEDPELARRVARHRALRDRLSVAYRAELSEPIPERLLAAARRAGAAPASGKIVELGEVRAALAVEREREKPRAANGESSFKSPWRSLGGIAAGILLGLGVGYRAGQPGHVPVGPPGNFLGSDAGGTLIAVGSLQKALTEQAAAAQSPASPVRIGMSFRDRAGEYCRSFALSGAGPAGFACHQGENWRIESLVRGLEGRNAADYRTAATELPPLLLAAIEAQIDGEPLDQAAEAVARQQGWRAPAR